MSRIPNLSNPHLLGFEHLERILDHVSKNSAEGYPPYNIEQVGGSGLRITLAVAGFSLDDLTVTLEDNQLVIRGRKNEEEEGAGRVFLHRGIASRQFQRSFVIAEGIEITGASLDNGLLCIDLVREEPEPEVRTIKIEKRRTIGRPAYKAQRTIDVEPEG
jgi:HSP20 family molecular chaperone IbpA